VVHRIATGFDLQPLPDGNVLIEFYGDDGKTFNSQIVPREVVEGMPAVASLTLVYMDQGAEAVKRVMGRLKAASPEEGAAL
jgi:hypothetical protein